MWHLFDDAAYFLCSLNCVWSPSNHKTQRMEENWEMQGCYSIGLYFSR